jgi:hypothetical protein
MLVDRPSRREAKNSERCEGKERYGGSGRELSMIYRHNLSFGLYECTTPFFMWATS